MKNKFSFIKESNETLDALKHQLSYMVDKSKTLVL